MLLTFISLEGSQGLIKEVLKATVHIWKKYGTVELLYNLLEKKKQNPKKSARRQTLFMQMFLSKICIRLTHENMPYIYFIFELLKSSDYFCRIWYEYSS